MIDTVSLAAYGGLFLASFLAATLLPLGSESVLVAMAVNGFSPGGLLVVATMGNSLGAVVNYGLGRWGKWTIDRHRGEVPMPAFDRAQAMIRKWGAPAMLMAWMPVIGDPLTILAGLAGMRFGGFFFWMCLGKGLRYAALLLATGQVQHWLRAIG